jgi:hypothetical protein
MKMSKYAKAPWYSRYDVLHHTPIAVLISDIQRM